MFAVAAYESIEDAWPAGDLAEAVGGLCSSFPGIDQAYVSLPGSGTEQAMPLETLQSVLSGKGHFAASLLCSKGRQSDDYFLSSVPMMMIENLPESRAVYLVFELDELKRVAGNLVACFDRLGEGFGYIAGSEDAPGALDYALDMDVMHDFDQMEALLEPRERWREHLRSRFSKSKARNLYPINLWPKSYLRLLDQEPSFTEAKEAAKIRLLRRHEHVDVVFAERSASSALAPLDGRLFFEGLGQTALQWLDGSHADQF